MRFSSELIFVAGKRFEKDKKTYRVALLADMNGDVWGSDWQEVFVSDDVYKKMQAAQFGQKLVCDFRVNKGRVFLQEVRRKA